MKKKYRVTLSDRAKGLDTIAVSAGKIGYQVELTPQDLIQAAQALAGEGLGEAGDGADHPGGDGLHGPVLGPGVEADGGDLLLHRVFPRLGEVGHGVPDGEGPAGHLQVGQPVALGVPGDLVDPGGEVPGVDGGLGVPVQAVQEFPDPLGLQPRAEVAGEELPQADEAGHVPVRKGPGIQIPVQQPLVPEGHGLRPVRVPGGEGHAALVQPPPQVRQDGRPAGAGEVGLGDEEEGGDGVPPEEPPQGLGVGLDPVGGGDHQHGAVQHRQGALHLRGEVHVAGGVQEGDGKAARVEPGLLGEDGDAPVPL